MTSRSCSETSVAGTVVDRHRVQYLCDQFFPLCDHLRSCANGELPLIALQWVFAQHALGSQQKSPRNLKRVTCFFVFWS